jgi:signal transduction histidine kinase
VEISEPATGPVLQRVKSWRRLPLATQLILIGIIVGVTWLLTARLSADRVAEKQREMNTLRDQLHQAEVSGARVLTHVMTMAAAHRGHLLNGAPRYLERYEQARRGFGVDIGAMQGIMARDVGVRIDTERLITIVAAWDREIVQALGAEMKDRRFRSNRMPEQGDSLVLGAAVMDEFRAVHTRLMRSLREDVIRLEAESETEAALDEWEVFLLRAAAVAIFALLLTMLLRLVSRSLQQVVLAAEALDAGRYEDARLPNAHRAPNKEMASLGRTFDRLAHSIEQREGQLQDDIIQLKELERLKADFVSTVSHELRTPLTSMRGALGLLLSGAGGELSPKGRDLLRIALTNTDRLIRLINDILDIEKIDAGHVEIRRDRLRLWAIVESTMAGLEGLARDADVRLEVGHCADVEVFGDADRLTQVFTNLISNAVKFSPKGAAVELSGKLVDGTIRVGVRDHGPGIPPEFASRIFGRFQQAESAELRRSGGTGLGLSISKARSGRPPRETTAETFGPCVAAASSAAAAPVR